MKLLTDGNGPVMDLSETPTATSAKLSITNIPTQTQSSVIISPINNTKSNTWAVESVFIWGLVIVLLIAGVIYWIKNIK